MSSTFTKKKKNYIGNRFAVYVIFCVLLEWKQYYSDFFSSLSSIVLFLCPVVMSNLQPELSKIALIFACIGTFYVLVWATRYLLAGN
jgi:hypothetical protein